MKRYYFELIGINYEDLGIAIPDGWHKSPAIKYAKEWMKENGIQNATLIVNSLKTDDVKDVIDLEVTLGTENIPPSLHELPQNSNDSEQPVCLKPDTNTLVYVPSQYLGLSPDNYRRATVTLSAAEYERFCKTRLGRALMNLGDYRPCNLLNESG